MLDRVDQQVRHRAAEQRRIDGRARVAVQLGAQLRFVERDFEEVEHAPHFVGERHVLQVGRAFAAALRDRNSMSLMITRSRSNSSRFDCSVRSIRSTVRSRLVSATWVWPIRMLTGVRSSCATSALNASSRA